MIQISPMTPIYVHTGFVDFRKGIDGLGAVCRQEFGKDPMSGAMFVFRGRNQKGVKILVYDGQGFWLFQKRLSVGRFRCWPTDSQNLKQLFAKELYVLIFNGDFDKTCLQEDWKPLVDTMNEQKENHY